MVAMPTSTRFVQEQAPCGRTGDGEHVRDDDDDGLVIDHWYWECSCRKTLHQFHDGSIQVRVYGHHGKLLTDERSALHEA
jgi:hypothetical protein